MAASRFGKTKLVAELDDLFHRHPGLAGNLTAFLSRQPHFADSFTLRVIGCAFKHTVHPNAHPMDVLLNTQWFIHFRHHPFSICWRRHDCNRFSVGMYPCRKGTPSRRPGKSSSLRMTSAPVSDALPTRGSGIWPSRTFSVCRLHFAEPLRRTPGRTAPPHSAGTHPLPGQSRSCLLLEFLFRSSSLTSPIAQRNTAVFRQKRQKRRKKEGAFFALLQSVLFCAAPRRLLPDFSSGQAKTHEKVLCSGAFSCALVCPGWIIEKSRTPLFHVLWFYTDSL